MNGLGKKRKCGCSPAWLRHWQHGGTLPTGCRNKRRNGSKCKPANAGSNEGERVFNLIQKTFW